MASGIADHQSKFSNTNEAEGVRILLLFTGVTTRSALQERLLSAVKEVSKTLQP